MISGFFERMPIITRSIQADASSGSIFRVNDIEQVRFDEFHQWYPARLCLGIIINHCFRKYLCSLKAVKYFHGSMHVVSQK